MTLTLHNYRWRQIYTALNGDNLSSAFRDMPSAKSGAGKWPPAQSNVTIPLQPEGLWGNKLAEWRSGSVSALPCERPGFGSRTRLREIIPANNCTTQGQNNWGNWGSPGVMKLWVAWEVLRWLMKFRELCSGGFHPKLVTPPYHGFLNVNTPPNSQN